MALLPSDPKRHNAVLIAVVAVLGFYFGFFDLWYGERVREIVEMEADLERLETSNRTAKTLAEGGEEGMEGRLILLERHLAKLEELIPRSGELPSLLDDINRDLTRLKLEPVGFSPDSEEPVGGYTKRTFNFEIAGDYHDVGRFLGSIASLSRIIAPVNLGISLDRGASPAEERFAVAARFQIQTYVLPPRGDAR